tara:strand:- start:213 stop:527 length:315 start_codon:yes stop_codon:yes gene_type:complete
MSRTWTISARSFATGASLDPAACAVAVNAKILMAKTAKICFVRFIFLFQILPGYRARLPRLPRATCLQQITVYVLIELDGKYELEKFVIARRRRGTDRDLARQA